MTLVPGDSKLLATCYGGQRKIWFLKSRTSLRQMVGSGSTFSVFDIRMVGTSKPIYSVAVKVKGSDFQA